MKQYLGEERRKKKSVKKLSVFCAHPRTEGTLFDMGVKSCAICGALFTGEVALSNPVIGYVEVEND